MARVYYNENDPNAANWLRGLITLGLIPAGDVDDRSIVDVQPNDLIGYTQCHFFAGIGGWAYAARLAGWSEDRELWSGSCPCQPFSVAGKRAGSDDDRHLWPHFFRLIRARRPSVILGEQVAGKAGYGWLDGVAADLEGEDYACRAVDIPACAVDAPHIRSRLYWLAVADADHARLHHDGPGSAARPAGAVQGIWQERQRLWLDAGQRDESGRVGDASRLGWGEGRPEYVIRGGWHAPPGTDVSGGVDDADGARLEGISAHDGDHGAELAAAERADVGHRPASFWAGHDWIICHDGKARRTEPGISLLAHGTPNRVAKWRGLGNAIVAPLAAEVIAAYIDTCP